MKLRPRKARTIIPYVIIYLLIVIVTYFPIGFVWPPTLYHYLSLGAWTIGFTLFIYVGVRYNSYEIHKSHIVHLKGQARLTYNFSSILYIDIPYTNKHKTLLFYTDQGDARYLVLDPKNILLTKTLNEQKCNFQRRISSQVSTCKIVTNLLQINVGYDKLLKITRE